MAFDPRGVGLSRPAINCHMNAERESKPLPTPSASAADLVRGSKQLIRRCMRFRPNRRIIPYVSTENVVRDLDQLRAAVGDSTLNYVGYSYGTAIGAMYDTLYPDRVGRIVLDGPLDLQAYFNRPLDQWVQQVKSSQTSSRDSYAPASATRPPARTSAASTRGGPSRRSVAGFAAIRSARATASGLTATTSWRR